ncbi:MAG: hypothetical protein ACLKAK_05850 [Alkaliphilus sp.]
MKSEKSIKVLCILSLLILLILTSCKPNEKNAEQEKEKNTPPKLPEVLTAIEKQTLEIMYIIDSVPGIKKSIAEKNIAKKDIEKDTEVPLKVEEKDTIAKDKINMQMLIITESTIIPLLKEEEIESEFLKELEVPDSTDEVWFEINKQISEIHSKWNVLEPELNEVNVSKSSISQFEKVLDLLTINAESELIIENLFALNQLTNYLANYRSFFKSKTPHEAYNIKYQLRKSVLLSSVEEYNLAKIASTKAAELGSALRQRLIEKKANDVVQKIELSINDLSRQIDSKQFPLIQINGGIAMKNCILMINVFEGSMQ